MKLSEEAGRSDQRRENLNTTRSNRGQNMRNCRWRIDEMALERGYWSDRSVEPPTAALVYYIRMNGRPISFREEKVRCGLRFLPTVCQWQADAKQTTINASETALDTDIHRITLLLVQSRRRERKKHVGNTLCKFNTSDQVQKFQRDQVQKFYSTED